MDELTLDKSALQVDDLASLDESAQRYWEAKSPSERLEALEFLRQQLFAYDPTTTRLQRVLSITERT